MLGEKIEGQTINGVCHIFYLTGDIPWGVAMGSFVSFHSIFSWNWPPSLVGSLWRLDMLTPQLSIQESLIFGRDSTKIKIRENSQFIIRKTFPEEIQVTQWLQALSATRAADYVPTFSNIHPWGMSMWFYDVSPKCPHQTWSLLRSRPLACHAKLFSVRLTCK